MTAGAESKVEQKLDVWHLDLERRGFTIGLFVNVAVFIGALIFPLAHPLIVPITHGSAALLCVVALLYFVPKKRRATFLILAIFWMIAAGHAVNIRFVAMTLGTPERTATSVSAYLTATAFFALLSPTGWTMRVVSAVAYVALGAVATFGTPTGAKWAVVIGFCQATMVLVSTIYYKSVRHQAAAEVDRDRLKEEAHRAEKRAIEKDLEVAAGIQTLLLPRVPTLSVPGLKMMGSYQAAAHAGGDWWWYEPYSDGTVDLILGDVTGHGAGSAMLTAVVAGAFKAVKASTAIPKVEDVLAALDASLAEVEAGQMTYLYVRLDPARRTAFASTGACPPFYVVDPQGKVTPFIKPGKPLGRRISARATFQFSWQEGSRLFAFTDGVSELATPKGHFGLRRVQAALVETGGLPLEPAFRRIDDILCDARGGTPLADDVTYVLCELG